MGRNGKGFPKLVNNDINLKKKMESLTQDAYLG